jgi:hypothetical protein
MATLKSPRNSRKKKNWAQSSGLKALNKPVNLNGKLRPRSRHHLQSFLRNSAHWVVSEPASTNQLSPWLPEHIEDSKPPVYVKYGRKSINYSTVYPFVFHRESRDAESSANIIFWSNSQNVNPR